MWYGKCYSLCTLICCFCSEHAHQDVLDISPVSGCCYHCWLLVLGQSFYINLLSIHVMIWLCELLYVCYCATRYARLWYCPSTIGHNVHGICCGRALQCEGAILWRYLQSIKTPPPPPPTSHVLVVSHGGLIHEVMNHMHENFVCELPARAETTPNTAVSSFLIAMETEPELRCVSVTTLCIHDASHLQ